jgi:hypothetical protein
MNKLKKLYRDFFGLQEQSKPTTPLFSIPKIDPNTASELDKIAQAANKLKQALGEEEIVDEAQLVNNITDYRGGVEYVLRDPAFAQQVASEIQEWTERKGFTVVKRTISKTGKIGYFYFRLGNDPALESQRIQGYIAQKPEIKHFRFNVRGQKSAPAPQPVIKPTSNKFNQNKLQ